MTLMNVKVIHVSMEHAPTRRTATYAHVMLDLKVITASMTYKNVNLNLVNMGEYVMNMWWIITYVSVQQDIQVRHYIGDIY